MMAASSLIRLYLLVGPAQPFVGLRHPGEVGVAFRLPLWLETLGRPAPHDDSAGDWEMRTGRWRVSAGLTDVDAFTPNHFPD
jgi:hypothetical protein